ncbi:transforming growth factor-beta-induced protein [Catalinimonas alkaloidigena]|uniref:fasciclin domain-containing protein n=1 Tax=Catalinimonas alkaloidigena TaxID=1075417 RepID=UPI00240504D4|nr:fasciclin domain-containing protein [Catalinimonas alkaloidigena]MDF9795990.1 transforming growth factor-beta-induced protein [Catalinimonas alkaloidigena]
MKKSIFKFKCLFYVLGLFSLSLLLFTACDEDDDNGGMTDPEPTQNIVEIAQGDDRFEILVSAVVAAGLDDDLSGTGPFTVFAPTDAAFEDLLANTDGVDALEDISEESLVQILQYHVAALEATSGDLTDGQSVPTLLSGESVTIGINGSTVTVDNATVIEADIMATNGVIHAIDQILVPEGFEIELAPQTIAEIASETDALSTLVAALGRVPGLIDAAGDESADLTVFAPTNDAFAALLETLTTATGDTYASLDDVPDYVLERVLQYHVLAAAKTASELTESEETLEGSSLSINGTTINGSTNVVDGLADIQASNGVVHVIDAVLVPSFILNSLGTVLEPAVFDPEGRFTTLLAAVETAELEGALTDADATLTVFAPTNDAFTAYIDGSDFTDAAALLASELLDEILLYHVLGATVPSSAIGAGPSSAPSLYDNDEGGPGEEIYISNNGADGIFLNGYAQVILPDLEEANGVVHVIDAVLVPPMSSIAEIVVAAASDADSPQFTLLLAALQNADDTEGSLVELLSSEDGTYTVFAPTDQAFIDAGFADVAAIEDADPALLRAVLLYHVVPAPVFSTDLASGAVTTAGGADITVTVADPVTIADLNEASADAEVIDVNILATNGVIHVINQVLLPE